MANDDGWGSSLWREVQKVRITDGTLEAPVKADGDGIRIGPDAEKPAPQQAEAPTPRRRGLLARLFGRR